MSKLIYSQIGNLLNEGLITHKEYDLIASRLEKAKARDAEAIKTDQVRLELKAFMVPGIEYKISDLVLGVSGIKAPCHGYKETDAEAKHRNGTIKPRFKRALDMLGVITVGTGAQTRYVVEPQLPAIITIDEVDDQPEA
jgi:hypothetical protein